MEKEPIKKITEESREIIRQTEFLLSISIRDVISFVCGDMNEKEADRLRDAFKMLEDYHQEKELARESGIPSIRMIKYGICLEQLESRRMQEVYDFYLSQKSELKAMMRRNKIWMDFCSRLEQKEKAEVIAAGEFQSNLVYSSRNDIPMKYRWRMTLSIPALETALLHIKMESPSGKPIQGKLLYCSNELLVENGDAWISQSVIKQSNETEVVFIFDDGTRIPGDLEL